MFMLHKHDENVVRKHRKALRVMSPVCGLELQEGLPARELSEADAPLFEAILDDVLEQLIPFALTQSS